MIINIYTQTDLKNSSLTSIRQVYIEFIPSQRFYVKSFHSPRQVAFTTAKKLHLPQNAMSFCILKEIIKIDIFLLISSKIEDRLERLTTFILVSSDNSFCRSSDCLRSLILIGCSITMALCQAKLPVNNPSTIGKVRVELKTKRTTNLVFLASICNN